MLEQKLEEHRFTKSEQIRKEMDKSPHSSLFENNHTASAFLSTAALQMKVTLSLSNRYCWRGLSSPASQADPSAPLSSFPLTFHVPF